MVFFIRGPEVSEDSDVLLAVIGLDSDRPESIEKILDMVVSQKVGGP